MKRLVLIVILLCLALFGCSKQEKDKSAPVSQLREGTAAPDFTLKDLNGRDVSLSSLKGKVVFLNFWATWCPPCKEEIPSMMKLNQQMTGKSFQMLAVSIDEGGKDAVTAFFKRTGFNLPSLNDPEQKAGKLYGITGVPETFVIDKNGVVVKKVIGGMDWASADSVQFFSDLASK
jgi:peroxiredoxin